MGQYQDEYLKAFNDEEAITVSDDAAEGATKSTGTAVTIDKWKEETDDKGVRRADIVATLIVDRESHKPIVIGEKGAKLREISRLAHADIEEQLGCPVHLEVWVRVRRGWSDDVKALKTLGYD